MRKEKQNSLKPSIEDENKSNDEMNPQAQSTDRGLFARHKGAQEIGLELAAGQDEYSAVLESICGTTDDSQPVEQYNGALGVTTAFVAAHQAPACQVQWNNNLGAVFTNPGNVTGERWGSGTMISDDLLLTCGHLFDQTGGGWQRPRQNGTTNIITPQEIARNMHVNFNFQVDPAGNLRPEQSFPILELTEFRLGGVDMAICRVGGNPGATFGRTLVSSSDAAEPEMICIIGHPDGQPKRIEAGPTTDVIGNQIHYGDIDTLGGNSGSGILRSSDGRLVGIHTNGGCGPSSPGDEGTNFGQRIEAVIAVSPTLQSLLLSVPNFGYNAGGWRVERHPRLLADLTGDRRADIVGFGNAGVYVALNNGNGTFQPIRRVVDNFGYDAGGWRIERHPRLLADLTGDGRADIVGFGNAGVYVALNNGNGTFQPIRRVVDNFGFDAGGWRVESHPRLLGDLTGDGRADIVGFGNAGVYVALNNGNGTFQPLRRVVDNFGFDAGGWRVESHPRLLADLTGDGRADIVGFGNAGVYVALNNGNGTFQPLRRVVDNFGFDAGGWRIERHPRFLADLTGDGRADIVGFANAGVYVALNNGNGTFQPLRRVVDNFGYDAGGWRIERHPRFLADLTGDGRADIVGFGNAGVYVALNNGNGTFQPIQRIVDNFGYDAGSWRVERHPRFLADLTDDSRADIVGFGDDGVIVRLT